MILPSQRKNWLAFMPGLAVGLLGILILFKDLWLAGVTNVLWANDLDPKLIYWIVNWGYHVLFESRDPVNFWNANTFYPTTASLAYNEPLLGMQLLFAPLRIMGFLPLMALYLTLAGMCLIGASLTDWGLRRVGGFSFPERAFIIFAAHFGLGVANYAVHYQMFGFQLAPPFFLFLYLYFRDRQEKDALVAVLCYVVGISFLMYFGPMLLVLTLVLALPTVGLDLKRSGVRSLIRLIPIRSTIVGGALFAALYFFILKPYLDLAKIFPTQSLDDTATYSANLTSLITGISTVSVWYGPTGYDTYGTWEFAFFPGWLLLVLAGLYVGALAMTWVHRRTAKTSRALEPVRPIARDLIGYLLILMVACIVLSWGPLFKQDHSIKLPFYYLSQLIYGLDKLRAPGRFGMFLGLPLAIFGIGFLRWLLADSKKRGWTTCTLFVVLAFESLPRIPVYPFPADSDGMYDQIAQIVPASAPLLEMPVSGKNFFDTIDVALNQMIASTNHWDKLVVGYGITVTPTYAEILDIDNRIKAESVQPEAAIEFAKRYEISYLLVRLDRYSPAVQAKWRAVCASVYATVLFQRDNRILIRINDD